MKAEIRDRNLTYVSFVAWEIPGRNVVSGGHIDNLIHHSVELLKLVSHFLITCVLSQEDVSVHFGLLAEVLVQILEGWPISLSVEESRLIEEVSEAERCRCRCTVISIVVADRLHSRLSLECISNYLGDSANVKASGFVN